MATCTAITRKGYRCRCKAKDGQEVCGTHLPKPDVECPVCYETFSGKSHKITTLTCGHKVCGGCCLEWGRQNSTCPICRADVLPKQWQGSALRPRFDTEEEFYNAANAMLREQIERLRSVLALF